MSNLNRIVWIDDNPDREDTARAIDAVFINVNEAEGSIEKKLGEFFSGDKPKLVILDHYLEAIKSESMALFHRGSTIAEAVKERWPSCPVIGITAADGLNIDDRTQDAYDDFFDYNYFGSKIVQISAIASGFARIEATAFTDSAGLIDLLCPPVDEKSRLYDALPESLKKVALDGSVSSAFYHWVRHLRERAGFLYDSLWVATSLGLNEQGFRKVHELFTTAKYTGIFDQEDDLRWWANLVVKILYENVEPESGKFTWHVGRKLPGLEQGDFSVCRNCSKEYPETVAYLDRKSSERSAVHLECTSLHPGYKRELYFEDVRMMDVKNETR